MSLDVSPEGGSLVFELLGDLYTLPVTGGKATRITSGLALDTQPRFSPDGKRIAKVGNSSEVSTPAGAREIDVSGKTLLPGFIDTHAHMWPAWGVHRGVVWEYPANLAYGVLTTRDPQTSTTAIPGMSIHNTNSISLVMKNGLLYNANTLDQIWPVEKKLPQVYWTSDDPVNQGTNCRRHGSALRPGRDLRAEIGTMHLDNLAISSIFIANFPCLLRALTGPSCFKELLPGCC